MTASERNLVDHEAEIRNRFFDLSRGISLIHADIGGARILLFQAAGCISVNRNASGRALVQPWEIMPRQT